MLEGDMERGGWEVWDRLSHSTTTAHSANVKDSLPEPIDPDEWGSSISVGKTEEACSSENPPRDRSWW